MGKFIDLTNRIFGDLKAVNYETIKDKIYWSCECKGGSEACEGFVRVRSDRLINNEVKACKKCSRIWEYEEGMYIIDDKRDIKIVRQIHERINYKYYEIKCNKPNCGGTYIGRESEIKSGRGCPICSGKQVYIGINDIPTKCPEAVEFFQGDTKKLKIILLEAIKGYIQFAQIVRKSKKHQSK